MNRYQQLVLFLLMLCVVGCGRAPRLRVGSKDFTESKILAEMIAQLAEEEGIEVERKIPFGRPFECLRGIEHDELDIYPDYTGSILALKGASPEKDRDAAMKAVRDVLPADLVWGKSLGFNNRFMLYVLPGLAEQEKLKKISDLKKLSSLRLGCTETFVLRAVDGYTAMISAYGFRDDLKPTLVEQDKTVLAQALQDRKLDVVVDDETSGYALEYGWVSLEDDKEFFPAYEAAPIVRAAVLESPHFQDKLKPVMKSLAGILTVEEMRELVKEGDIYGAPPAEIARQFLVEKQFLPPRSKATQRRQPVSIAVLPGLGADEPSRMRSRLLNVALRAVRKTNPQRRVQLIETTDVEGAIVRNEAFVGVLGAEGFFSFPDLQRTQKIEAVAVLGYEAAHVLCMPKNKDLPFGKVKALGVGPRGGASEKGGLMLLAIFGLPEQTIQYGEYKEQIELLRKGKLDAVLVMAEQGNPRIANWLEGENALALKSLTSKKLNYIDLGQKTRRFPFPQRVEIPAGIYKSVAEPIQTLRSQVVLVGPAPGEINFGDGGPSSAVSAERKVIPATIQKVLRKEIGVTVRIHPSLPGQASQTEKPEQPINPTPWVSILTLFLFGGGIWMVLSVARSKPTNNESPLGEQPESPPASSPAESSSERASGDEDHSGG